MIVLVYFWKINLKSLPIAILHMAFDRFTLRGRKEVSFYKSLGTGKGETFTPSDADAKRWGLLVVIPQSEIDAFDSSKLISSWRKIATLEYRGVLQPISSHGKWSKVQPFNENQVSNWGGPVAALTRARIKWHMNSKFWSAVPPVTVSLKSTSGLQSAIGIGEAPIGLQGTFSRWESAAALRNFAYQGAAHTKAIQATKDLDWYTEELFARFAIIEEHGGF
ncbi:MAG: spheroidene monooxygenase [Candidatus Nanopelagicaceae bacterium]